MSSGSAITKVETSLLGMVFGSKHNNRSNQFSSQAVGAPTWKHRKWVQTGRNSSHRWIRSSTQPRKPSLSHRNFPQLDGSLFAAGILFCVVPDFFFAGFFCPCGPTKQSAATLRNITDNTFGNLCGDVTCRARAATTAQPDLIRDPADQIHVSAESQ